MKVVVNKVRNNKTPEDLIRRWPSINCTILEQIRGQTDAFLKQLDSDMLRINNWNPKNHTNMHHKQKLLENALSIFTKYFSSSPEIRRKDWRMDCDNSNQPLGQVQPVCPTKATK